MVSLSGVATIEVKQAATLANISLMDRPRFLPLSRRSP
jgi:hypothetical protein